VVESEYLVFTEIPHGGHTTKVWNVLSKRHGDLLGRIKWFGAWRQYVFQPMPATLFNRGCLADVGTFIAEQMAERNATAAK
jgi:hypothetical protein